MLRRLTTIIAADIAGFSKLVGLDEEGTLAAQRGHREALIDPLVARHGGRIANTAGVSLLIEFTSTIEATRFAVALQDGMRERNAGVPADLQILYRIGINVGDVVAQGEDLFGDGVNIAARLEGLCPPGSIVLSPSARDAVRDRLELNLADLGEVAVKNIGRPVRVFQVLRDGERPMRVAAVSKRDWRRPVAAGIVLVALAAAGLWWWSERPEHEPADPAKMAFAMPLGPSIAVMPFDSIGTEVGAERLGDGLAADIVEALTRFRDIAVISTESTAAYKDTGTPLRQVAEEMGVKHVLAGSIERDGDRLRIGVRLVDALSGQQVWSKRFDVEGSDLFSVRDEVSRAVAAQLGAQDSPLAAAWLEPSRRKDVTDLGLYEQRLVAQELQHRRDQADNAEARRLLDRVVERDPLYARAWVDRAWVNAHDAWNGWSDDPERSMHEAIASAEQAIEADPFLSDGYWVLGSVSLCFGDDQVRALEAYRKALELNPNSPDAMVEWGGYALPAMFMDRAEEGVAMVKRAMRLNPRHADWYDGALVSALFFAGRHAEAVQAYKAVDYPAFNNRVHVAASYGYLGDEGNGRRAVEELLQAKPGLSLGSLADVPEMCPKGTSAEGMEYIARGLAKAGLPL